MGEIRNTFVGGDNSAYGLSGVYSISSINTDRIYIGSSINIGKRLSSHKRELEKGTHRNKKLQNHYNKYENDILKFSIISVCEDYRIIEQEYINKLDPYFNIVREVETQNGEHNFQKVWQYDDSGNKLYEYDSIKEASNATGIDSRRISDCANGVKKKAGKFIFIKPNEDLNLEYRVSSRNPSFGNLGKGKAINQYTMEGVFIKKWSSANVAAKALCLSRSNIRNVCRGLKNSIGGFKWEDCG
jgi:hypothetical protein